MVLPPSNVIKNNGANPMMEVCTIDCYPSGFIELMLI